MARFKKAVANGTKRSVRKVAMEVTMLTEELKGLKGALAHLVGEVQRVHLYLTESVRPLQDQHLRLTLEKERLEGLVEGLKRQQPETPLAKGDREELTEAIVLLREVMKLIRNPEAYFNKQDLFDRIEEYLT